jgi:molybdenum cofactor cytidylyltransferase
MMTEPREKVAGLILAAGISSRMGKTKQLLKIGGKTLAERVLGEALKSNLDEVVLVLGYRAEAVRQVLSPSVKDAKVRVVENRHYREGMGSSIRVGLGAVEESAAHVMIILADMPHINAEIINLLLLEYLASGKSLGAVSVRGRRSHPVILGRERFGVLRELKGDVGARRLFDAFKDEICLVEGPAAYDDLDLDTPEDYRKALSEAPES